MDFSYVFLVFFVSYFGCQARPFEGDWTSWRWQDDAETWRDLEEKRAVLEERSFQTLVRRVREVVDTARAQGRPTTAMPVTNTNPIDSEDTGFCETEHCQKVANEILRSMDDTKAPCDDFYQYACGNWDKHNPMPDTFGSYSSFVKLREQVETKLKALLEEPSPEDEHVAFTMSKQIYRACMDVTTIDALGDTPLRTFISSLGSWPVLEGDEWDEDGFDLVDLLVKGRKEGKSVLMMFMVGTDYKTPTSRVFKIDQARLSLPSRDFYLHGRNTSFLRAYEDLAFQIARKLGVPEDTARRDCAAVLDFEIKLANLTLKLEERRDFMALYQKMTIAELKQRIPGFDWLAFINGVMSGVLEQPVTDDEPVLILSEKYLKKMMKLVINTPKRVVANYVMMRFVKSNIMDLSHEFRALLSDYKMKVSGVQKDLPRWHTCVQLADRAMPSAVGRMFVQRYFDENSKHKVTEMLNLIGDVMKQLLDDTSWMEPDTIEVAKEKANDMVYLIGYPDRILDDDKLAEEYSRLQVNQDGHFENVQNFIEFKSNKYLRKLRDPVDRTQWDATRPADVNAYYDPTMNHLVFPSAVLQPPFYDKNSPNYMNFGGIGMVIGHEITHGFDDLGRQFDGDGKLHYWWDQSTISHFKSKAQCMVEQYGNYTLRPINRRVNGLLTQGENIADNGGLKEAYIAYQKWVEDHGPEPRLPGIDLKQSQLFFLNFAQIWCSTVRPQTAVNRIMTDYHSPSVFRVTGPLSNLPAFSEAYNCPLGSRMNPSKKCSVW